MSYLAEYDVDTKFKGTINKTVRITPEEVDEVREIKLTIDRPNFDYEPGQSIGVNVRGPHEFGNEDHVRLYSVVDAKKVNGKSEITIVVKRCNYIDPYSGELYRGVASNYLCDLREGDKLEVAGPYGLPFEIPEDKNTDLLLIGMGTGIAPFRAFMKKLHKNQKEWKGKIWLFYGAKTGLELLYLNDEESDFTNYYDKETFQAFKALSPRPHWADPIALDYAIEERAEEIVRMLDKPKTRVYIAGMEEIKSALEKALSNILGSKEALERKKAEMEAGKRWVELIY